MTLFNNNSIAARTKRKAKLAGKSIAAAALLFATMATANINAPGNISGSEDGSTITLNWNVDAAATGYNVYKNGQYLNTVLQNTFTEELNAGEVANYYVVAFINNSEDGVATIYSPRSEQVTLPASAVPSDTTIPPSVPTDLSGSIDGSTVSITWSASTDDESVSGYNVYQNDQYLTTVFDTSYTGTVTAGNVYTYSVTAFDIRKNFSAASSNLTLPNSVVVDTTLPPTAATNLSGTIATGSSTDTATITWTASTDDQVVLGYNVYQNSDYVATVFGTSYSTSVNKGDTNRFYVVAFDNDRNFSAQSEKISVPESTTPVDTTIPPTQVVNLRGTIANGTATLNWDASTDDQLVRGYNVYQNKNYLTTVFDTAYSTPVQDATIYTFNIVAFDADNNFAPASADLILPEGTVILADGEPPSAPTNLRGNIADENGQGKLTLQWDAATDNGVVSGYNIYENNNYLTTISGTSFEKTVTLGQTYSYSVVAFDNAKNFSPRSRRIALPDTGNRAPTFENLTDQTVVAGQNWSMIIKPVDADGGIPGMFFSSVPPLVASTDNFDGTRTLSWRALQPDVGVYDFTVTAIDTEDTDLRTTRTVRLTVVLPDDITTIENLGPGIDLIEDQIVRVGDTVNLRVKGTDPNGTVPNLELLNQPANSTFIVDDEFDSIKVLSWTTSAADAGTTKSLNFRATDSVDPSLTIESTVNIRVEAPEFFTLAGPRLRDLADQRNFKVGFASALKFYERPDNDLYQDIAAQDYNIVTPENSMKWAYVNPKPNEFRWEAADTLVQYAAQNNMDVHGHTLVWYTALPQWVKDSAVEDREGLMNTFIDTMTSRYNTVTVWDVVNEAFEDNGEYRRSVWYEAMGEAHIEKAFVRARAGAPNAQLIYNDYDIAKAGPKSDASYNLVKRLIESDKPIDGIGFQMHLDTNFTQFDEVEANFQRFADLGVDIYVTELDVSMADGGTDAQQAEIFGRVTELCLANAACKALQVWGLSDRYSWRKPLDPLLLDYEYQAKPAYTAVQEALKP